MCVGMRRDSGWSALQRDFKLPGGILPFQRQTRSARRLRILVSLPSSLVLDMARERGYLNVAYCSVNHLLKRLAGVPGDRVTIDAAGVEVNGIHLANSSPLPCDAAGRPLQWR